MYGAGTHMNIEVTNRCNQKCLYGSPGGTLLSIYLFVHFEGGQARCRANPSIKRKSLVLNVNRGVDSSMAVRQ